MTDAENRAVERFREKLTEMYRYIEDDVIAAAKDTRPDTRTDAYRLAVLDALCERFPFASQRVIRQVLKAIK